ncbi:MAG: hypothetical protein KDA47_22600, partial [Planctomycetales bacterium]|nr:hypothetical protein [Planctomycetales bacterium]
RHTDLLYPTDHDTPATDGEDYTAQAGTLTFADGETEKTITIDLTDDAWFEGGEAFALKLTNATGGAELGSRSSLKVHIVSDDAKQAGEFVWSAASYVVTEGTPSVNVTIERLGGGNVEAAVHLYDTGAGNGWSTASAWAGSDYAYLPWEVVFAAGEMSKTISIPIVDDGSTERDEVFSIQLYSPSNDATIGALATTQVTIQDNDSAIEFAQSNYVVNESTGVMQIKVRRIGSTAGTATVDLNISSGSATAGQDFIKPPSPTVTFADGEFEKLVDIAIVDDVFAEGDESFYLSLSNATGAKLGTYLWGGGKILASD